MYAVINRYGRVINFENSDLGDPNFSYIEISSEAAVGLRAQRKAGKIPMYLDGEFTVMEPKLPKTWDDIRKEREPLFAEADAAIFKLEDREVLESVDLSADKALWAAYRKALRDVTEQADPNNVTWPSKPSDV